MNWIFFNIYWDFLLYSIFKEKSCVLQYNSHNMEYSKIMFPFHVAGTCHNIFQKKNKSIISTVNVTV